MINLVTGAAGFLGYHLCRTLLLKGEIVIGFDNLSSGSPKNIDDLQKNHEHFSFHQRDVQDLGQHSIWCNRIWHLACQASPPRYQRNMLDTLDTCYLGTKAVLMHAKAHSARVLFTSTSEIYGDPHEHPQTESYRGNVNTCGPRACYDEGKRIAETLCWVFGRQNGVDYRIARIFNTYGPRMNPDDGRVMTNFFKAAESGKSLEVFGDGLQTRSFCYAEDTIAGLIRLMESQCPMPINIGNNKEITILELAQEINDLYGGELGVTYADLPIDDPVRRRPDLTMAREIIGYEPKTSLKEGLAAMRSWINTEGQAK